MKKLPLLIIAFALLASTTYAEINLPEANIATMSQETMQSYQLYSDGTGNNPSIHWDGAKFTLTENIEGTITLMDDGIVFDGAGFTINGRGDSTGIAVYDKTGIIIKNVNVENFRVGILLGHYSPDAFLWYDPNPNRATNCTVNNCRVSNNTDGISITGGIKCRIIGNQVSNNDEGITFYGVENYFRNNQMKNNRLSFVDLTREKSDIDSSNTINGKPIYYLVNLQNLTVPADASLVHLEGCRNIIVLKLEIKGAYTAISLFNSSNCKIIANTLTNNEIGISIRDSINSSIIGNKLLSNSKDAIEQFDSENTTISNNLISANGCGIDSSGYSTSSRNAVILNNQIIENGCGIQAGTECTITGNYIEGNKQNGIYLWDISKSIIEKNSIIQNGECGISFKTGQNASIIGNDISKNNVGIEMGNFMGDLFDCLITKNNFAENINLALRIDSDIKNSQFYLNNFIDNNNGSVQISIKGRFVYKGDEAYNANSNVFPQFVASYNTWDNGAMGNFYSDNNSTDGTAYKITDNNIDHHRLLAPMEFSPLELPSTEVPQEFSEYIQNNETITTSSEVFLVLAIVLPIIAIATIVFRKRKKKLY